MTENAPKDAVQRFAIRAGGLFDGRSARGGTVVVGVRDGAIEEVGPAAIADDVAVLDFGPDAWLLPGLIDTHVHLVFDGSADPVAWMPICWLSLATR